MKLREGLYLVGSGSWGFDLSDELDCHIYLLDGGSEAALVDAGGGRNMDLILRNIEQDGVPLDRVRMLLLTHGHADHAAGAAGLKEALGLRVCAAQELVESLAVGDGWGISLGPAKAAGLYPADFVFRPCVVDVELKDGHTIPVGDCTLTVIETPGHSAGHLSYLMEKDGIRYLFGGDAVFFGGRIVLQNIPDCDLQAYLRTIERLSDLAVDVFLPGHLCFSLRNGQRHLNAAMEALSRLAVPPNLT